MLNITVDIKQIVCLNPNFRFKRRRAFRDNLAMTKRSS